MLVGGAVVERLDKPSSYVEARSKYRSDKEFQDLTLLETTSTLYVGNLSFYTTEEQIYELFSKCGEVKRIIMGLDRFQKTPCGFCFVEYQTHQQAVECMRFINGTKLDERLVRTDLDPGFKEGRQYGRGRSGGQVYFTFNRCFKRRFAMNTEKIMIPHGEDGENSAQSSK